jgi:hypothetical protein
MVDQRTRRNLTKISFEQVNFWVHSQKSGTNVKRSKEQNCEDNTNSAEWKLNGREVDHDEPDRDSCEDERAGESLMGGKQ